MNIHVTKSEAEVALAEAFDTHHAALPGDDAITTLREKAMAQFVATGLPTRRVEEYKYTDLRALMPKVAPFGAATDVVISDADRAHALGALADLDTLNMTFVNGQLQQAGEGALTSLRDSLKARADWVATHLTSQQTGDSTATIALNTALMQDGYVLDLDTSGDKPFHILFASNGEQAASAVYRSIIRVAKGCTATVIETHAVKGKAEHHTNSQVDIYLEEGAELRFVKVLDGQASAHLGTLRVHAEQNATFKGFQMTVGGKVSRNQVYATYAGEHALVDYAGIFLGRGNEHSDTTLVVDHAVPHGTSRELFKTVLDDEARGIFQGKVIVRQHAQKTDGKQMSQALLLSDTAEFDSKPELEIFADDVVCGHGATSGQIDDEQLFYLRARGIPEAQARSLLVQAFVAEAFEQIENETIQDALAQRTADWFENNEAA